MRGRLNRSYRYWRVESTADWEITEDGVVWTTAWDSGGAVAYTSKTGETRYLHMPDPSLFDFYKVHFRDM
jgi:hypothetical protein